MSKKILIIGPDFYNYNQSIERGFNRLGHDTKLYSYYANYNTIKNRVIRRIDKLIKYPCFNTKEIESINKDIVNIYKSYQPDLVLVIKGEIIYSTTLLAMSNSLLLYWMQDSIFRYPMCINTLKYYNKAFMFEKTDVDRLFKQGIKSYFLPMAVDETIYHPIDSDKDIDILFIGTLKGNRASMLQRLISDLPELNIKIYGAYVPLLNFKKQLNYYTKNEHRYFTNRTLTPEEANIAYSRAKIALNIHISQSCYGCNPRVLEILGTNTFQLVDHNEYIESELAGMLETYKSYEDLVCKIKHYIVNIHERERIATIGYNEVTKYHTYIDRISKIIEISELK